MFLAALLLRMPPSDQNSLHPLFDSNENETVTSQDQSVFDGSTEKAPSKRKRKAIESTASQNAMRNFLGIPKPQPVEEPPQCPVNEKKSRGRPRKQVRLSLDDEKEEEKGDLQPFLVENSKLNVCRTTQPLIEDADVGTAGITLEVTNPVVVEQSNQESRPLLKLNGLGGFGLPSEPKQVINTDAPPQESERPKRNRKRKRAIVLRYGRTVLSDRIRIGKQINHIFCQPQAVMPAIVEPESKPSPRRIRAKIDKVSHPFFTEKPKKGRITTPPPTNSRSTRSLHSPLRSTTTPGKMRSQMQAAQMITTSSVPIKPAVPSRIFSLPGTYHAAWPSMQDMHVRALAVKEPYTTRSTFGTRKRKSRNEVYDKTLPSHLGLISSQKTFVRPEKLLVSGRWLHETMSSQIKKDCLHHPALARLHKSILTVLTPFDVGAFESQLWTQKYAPRSAAEVLQAGHEAFELKQWLEGQTTAHSRPQKSRSKEEEKERRKKKRKLKQEGLDGFVVDSDDDVQAEPSIPNTILLSGPSGCGKTAAVFAVAKELGFDIFEIGPNSRRSGKDILDKVGDMSLNHQVRRAERASSITSSVDGNISELDFTLPTEPDAAQSTLTAFFGGGTTKTSKEPSVKKLNKKQEAQVNQLKLLKEKASSQKQSLILIEEADILYEEDKQFWETIITLSTQSKRPIIITCNDQSLIPQDELSLHTVLHFQHPPSGLVVEYLVLLAAGEGHLLQRHDVELLCSCRDLRGALSDLQYSCQMAVGDPKSGIDWYLQRWPAGVDKDAEGQTLRVMSSGTYHSSLLNLHNNLSEEEQLIANWRESQRDPRETVFALVGECLQSSSSDASEAGSRRQLLREYGVHFDHLSALDVSIGYDMPGSQSLDYTLPEITKKVALDYITGHKLLRRAMPAVDYEQFDTHLVAVTSLKLVHNLASIASRFKNSDQNMTGTEQLGVPTINRLPIPKLARTRDVLNTALDPLSNSSTVGLADRDLSSTILDTAPYARSIVSYDLALEQQRNSLAAAVPTMSQGSTSGGEGASQKEAKRARTTRASRSALEGNARAVTRRERWFETLKEEHDLENVMKTAISN